MLARGKNDRPHEARCGEIVRAFTLLELLLVMVVIVVIMSFSTPWLLRTRARSQLGNAGETLRNELYAVRLQAMRTGTLYVFRYRQNTGHYEIVPKDVFDASVPKHEEDSFDPEAELAVVRAVGVDVSGNFDSVTLDAERDRQRFGTAGGAYLKTLPHRYVFGAISDVNTRDTADRDADTNALVSVRGVGTEPVAASPDRWDPVAAATAKSATTDWSEPILFFPNGRTSGGVLDMCSTDDYPYRVTLSLRGLTGSAHLGKVRLIE